MAVKLCRSEIVDGTPEGSTDQPHETLGGWL